MAFVHLHVHSQYSLLDGTMSPEELAKRAAALGHSAVALTDTGNLLGAVAFYKACKDEHIRAVLGAELFVQPEGVAYEDPRRQDAGYQLEVLVEDDVGYRNLCALVTAGIFDGMYYKPRVDLDLLRQHAAGLIFLTGGVRGAVGEALRLGKPDEARQRVAELASFLGPEQLYLELQDLGLPGQDEVNAISRALAAELGRSTVVTNAVHYAEPGDAPVHELMNAISAGTSMSDDRRVVVPTDQAYLKTEAELRELFPDDLDAIERTAELAARCDYHFTFGDYHFPATTPPDVESKGTPQPDTDANWEYFYRAFPPPRAYGMPDPEVSVPSRVEGAGNLDGYFEWYSREGLRLRLEHVAPELHEAYRERLAHEIDIIEGMGFPAYMLIVAEFINWSKDVDIPIGPGRGSAAGSLVAFSMRITDIDPIRFGLLFERFLNPERVSMPDIDVDFCQDRREEAIEHVRIKYGTGLVSQIITYGRLKAKLAVRDVARVLGLYFDEADRIAKLIPADDLKMTIAKALAQVPALANLYERDAKVRRVLTLAQRVEGAVRQTGVHAAGVVIADRPLVEYAPLYRDGPEGGPVVQYDMKSAESIGLIKFDFLGLKTLDQIRDAVHMVERNHAISIDIGRIDDQDPDTFALLQDGDAVGVFQLESSGMRELLTRLRPTVLEELIALVALYRPGPLDAGMTDDYVERKHGRMEVTYPLPQLEPILRETYGTIVYQEQVMQVAQIMASYSLGEADILRRAMGKKKAEAMAEQRVRFLSGSVANGIDEARAGKIFDLLAKFAAYGFNKSHSAAYGYIAYQTAWLKAHYRPEYMAALMTIEAANTDKLLSYMADCRRAGIQVLPVCVNRSVRGFDVPPPSERPEGRDVIRFGLTAVKNVGGGAIEAILEAREAAGGAFRDPFDFFDKVDYSRVNRRVIENLIKAGGFDTFGLKRSVLTAGLDAVMRSASKRQADRASGQVSLFGGLAAAQRPPDFKFPEVPPWSTAAMLKHERAVLGMYLTGHPMDAWGRDVARFASAPIHEARDLAVDGEVRLAGVPSSTKVVRTKRGDRMAFVELEDGRASAECVFFADAWSSSKKVVQAGGAILVTGSLEVDDDELKLRASSAVPLIERRRQATSQVRIQLHEPEVTDAVLTRLDELLVEFAGDTDAVVVLRIPERFDVELAIERRVDPTVELEEYLRALVGRDDAVAML